MLWKLHAGVMKALSRHERLFLLTACVALVVIGCDSKSDSMLERAKEKHQAQQAKELEHVANSSLNITATPTTEAAEPLRFDSVSWPMWRGASQDGRADLANPPIHWTLHQNHRWSVPIPGRGHSSPIVVDGRVFLTTAEDQQQARWILCYDFDTGERLWEQAVHQGGLMPKHKINTYASSTLACDGKRVFACFLYEEQLWVTALTVDGIAVWQQPAGPFSSVHGYGSSPTLYGDYVIVNGDNPVSGFVAAMKRTTGEIVWRSARERVERGSYGTPVVGSIGDIPQLLLAGNGKVQSYDVLTGQSIWFCEGPSLQVANSVSIYNNSIYAAGGHPESRILRLTPSSNGDQTESVDWQVDRGAPYVPSLLVGDGNRVYAVSDQGVIQCLKSLDGEILYKKRLGGTFSSSPIIAGGKLYVTNHNGVTFVVRDSNDFELLSENPVDGGVYASPVAVNNRILIRSAKSLHCFENTQ